MTKEDNRIREIIIDLVNDYDIQGYVLSEEIASKYGKMIEDLIEVRKLENEERHKYLLALETAVNKLNEQQKEIEKLKGGL